MSSTVITHSAHYKTLKKTKLESELDKMKQTQY